MGKCIPIVIATSGAIAPSSLQWIDKVREDLPSAHRRPLAYYVRGIVHHNYTYLGLMYRRYKLLSDKGVEDHEDEDEDEPPDPNSCDDLS